MTEAEWLASVDVAKLLKRTRARPNGRKTRLLICAWCRTRWGRLDTVYRRGIEVAERFADGRASEAELESARALGRPATNPMYGVPCVFATGIQYTDAAYAFTHLASAVVGNGSDAALQMKATARDEQLALLRDVFGNPFRPVAFAPEWRTDTAVALARQMYDGRDFGAIPILADALQDAGCDSDDILSHCRNPGEHVRGCWVVDFVLGKE